MSKLFLCLLAAFLLVAGLGEGSAKAQPASYTDGGPLEITAEEGIEWRRDEQLYLARGKAEARREDMIVRADVLAAHYRQTEEGQEEIVRVEAIGGVEVETATAKVYSDRAVYYVNEQVLRFTGDDLRLETEEEKVFAQESLEYFEEADGGPLAVARGQALLTRADGERVEGDVISARFAGEGGPDRANLRRVEATGDVAIASENVFATGDEGVYYVEERQAVLDGNVKVTRGQNQLNGQRAEVDLRTGISRLLAGEGEPVRGLLSEEENAEGSVEE